MLKHLKHMPTDKILRLRKAAAKIYDSSPSYTQRHRRAGDIIGWTNNVIMNRNLERLCITPTPEHMKRPPTPWFQYEPREGCRWFHPDTAKNGEEPKLDNLGNGTWWAYNPWKDYSKPFESVARAAYWATIK